MQQRSSVAIRAPVNAAATAKHMFPVRPLHSSAAPPPFLSAAPSSAATPTTTATTTTTTDTASTASSTVDPSAAATATDDFDPFSDAALWSDLASSPSFTAAEAAAAAATAAESYGRVIGVSQGVISIEGLSTAHSGACIEFCRPSSFTSSLSSSSTDLSPSAVFTAADEEDIVCWGLVLSIHHSHVRAMVLLSPQEDIASVRAGDVVRHRKGHVPALSLPPPSSAADAADFLTGAVVDALGRRVDPHSLLPLTHRLPKPVLVDNPQPVDVDDELPSCEEEEADTIVNAATPPAALPILSHPPPSLSRRSGVHAFLPTGLINIDAFHSLAEGLRVGIMGAKHTGKTTLALQIIDSFNQQLQAQQQAVAEAQQAGANSGNNATAASVDVDIPALLPSAFHFVYCLSGASRGECRNIITRLQQSGSMSNCTVVVSCVDEPPAMQFLAPFLATTIADYYRDYRRESTVVIFDDLAAHGQVINHINLCYGAPVLPAAMWHARLLERFAPVTNGAASTALVLAETHRPDRPLDLIENIAGCVDHSLWLDPALAAKGLFPAINVASVLGRPAAKWRPVVLQALGTVLFAAVRESERVNNASKWAGEFGLQDELFDSQPLIELKDKMQLMLAQKPREAPLSIADQVLLLYALQHTAARGGHPLEHISLKNSWAYRTELFKALKHPQAADETKQMYAELVREILRRVDRRAAMRKQQVHTSRVWTQKDSNGDPLLHTELQSDDAGDSVVWVAAPNVQVQQLWKQYDDFLDRFEEDFIDKYGVEADV